MQCLKLEEVTLDDNLIHSIDGIGNLHSLKWLSLSSNQLSALPDNLWRLSKLRYLNISHNTISTLNHLKVLFSWVVPPDLFVHMQQLTSLMELYVSANLVSNLRELFSLKSLGCLIVLDLSLNPVACHNTYRSFVVYHLSFLKALDGRTIVSGYLMQLFQ